MNRLIITNPEANQADEINQLIINTFIHSVAPVYSQEGISFFISICKPDEIIENISSIKIAKLEKEIVGVIWMKNRDHISRFFVDINQQGKGIGTMLFNQVLSDIHSQYKQIENITVNASPNAFIAYQKLGFIKIEDEKTGNGMRYIPMMYRV